MRRLAMVLPSALLIFALMPATAVAAPGNNDHGTDSGTDVDPDFCGTGVSIDVSFEVTFTAHVGQPDVFRSTEHGRITFTNAATGDSVIVHFAQQFIEEITGDPEGVHTVAFTYKGLPEQIRTPNGPVLLRDAGYITFVDTFDGDVFLGTTVSVNKGPHPEADSDFVLFCEVTTAALGIS